MILFIKVIITIFKLIQIITEIKYKGLYWKGYKPLVLALNMIIYERG